MGTNADLTKQKVYKKSNMIVAGIMAIVSYMLVCCIPSSSLAVLLTTITAEMGLSPAQAASLSAGVALGTACFVFIAGVLLDKVSTRLLMCIFSIAAALMVYFRSVHMDFSMFYMLFPLLGVFFGVTIPGCNKTIALWFPKKYLFAMNSLIIGGGATAFIIGLNFTLPIASALGGWRQFFVALGIAMAILGVLWMVVIPERSSKDAELNKDIEVKNLDETKFWQNMKNVLSSPKVWVLCLSEFFFAGVIGASTSLGTTAIYQLFEGKLPIQTCATIASTGNTGSLVGYIVLPTALTKFFPKVDKVWPCSMSMIVSGILWSLAISGVNKSIPFMIFGFAFGAFWNGFGYVGPRTMLMELPEVAGLRAGTALGVFNTISRLGVTVHISFAGALASYLGSFNKAMTIVYLFAIMGAVFLWIYKAMMNADKRKAALLEIGLEAQSHVSVGAEIQAQSEEESQ